MKKIMSLLIFVSLGSAMQKAKASLSSSSSSLPSSRGLLAPIIYMQTEADQRLKDLQQAIKNTSLDLRAKADAIEHFQNEFALNKFPTLDPAKIEPIIKKLREIVKNQNESAAIAMAKAQGTLGEQKAKSLDSFLKRLQSPGLSLEGKQKLLVDIKKSLAADKLNKEPAENIIRQLELDIENSKSGSSSSSSNSTEEKVKFDPAAQEALINAIKDGEMEEANEIIDSGKVNLNMPAKEFPYPYPLHLAIEAQDIALVNNLLAHEADPLLANGRGHNSLHLAAIYGWSPEEDSEENLEEHPEEQHVSANKIAIIRALVSHNPALLKTKDLWGNTPLQAAIQDKQEDSIEELLNLGADTEETNNKGQTALALAKSFELTGTPIMDNIARRIYEFTPQGRAKRAAAIQQSVKFEKNSEAQDISKGGELPAGLAGLISEF
jgi:hypothetical protein